MKNRTLAISRGCIPYIKELRNIAGSVTASILMQQLDYWFDKTNGDPFYKFKAPCENEYYKNGDSFTEELGFSIEEFTNAFAKIGFSYKSKTEFENATNKFQAMFFCSYFDRKEGLTFYFRNHELLDTKLNQLFTVNGESRFIETGKVDLHKMAKSVSPIYITEDYNRRLQQKIDTASGFSQNENPVVNDSFTTQNPTVKESLTVQKQKKEEEFEQFKQFWILYEKPKKEIEWTKPNIARKKAYSLFQQRLKEMSFEELIENTKRYFTFKGIDKSETAPMDILPFLNGKCQVDYGAKVEAICKSSGKIAPLPQKTLLEAQREVVDTNALLELRNAKYNALTQKQKDTSDGIRNHLLTYFGEIHHEWIKSSIWFQQNLENDEINLHIRIFSEAKRKVIELNVEKIRDSLTNFKCNAVNEVIIKVVKN